MEDRKVIWRKTDLGYGRNKHTLIDEETGEILQEFFDCISLRHSYEMGTNSVMLGHGIAIGKEKADNSREYVTVTDYGGKKPDVVFGFWNNAFKRKRKGTKPKSGGGKKQYLKLYTEKLDNLDVTLAGVLVKLAIKADWETGKLKMDSISDIAKNIGCSRPTMHSYIEKLQKDGAIKKDDNGDYIINRDYIAKG